MAQISLFLLFTLLVGLHSFSEGRLADETAMLEGILDSYDKRFRPNGTEGELYAPVKVSISIYITGIESVDIEKGTFTPQFYFRQSWIDERLQFRPRTVQKSISIAARYIWVPDIFFDSEQAARLHNIPAPQSFVRISHNGEVLYSQRLTMTLGCPMNLQNYPFDLHLCQMRLESFQYTHDDLHLSWQHNRAVAIDPTAGLYDMSFAIDGEPDKVLLATSTGNYTTLIAGVTVKRSSTTAMVAYIPSTLLVIIAGLCLRLEVRATVARVAVLLGLLILMVLQTIVLSDDLPTLNYLTVMHDWLITCGLFIIMALVETILVSPGEVSSCPKRSELLRKIDLGFQVIYAVSFILFVIIYWSLIHANTKVDEAHWNSLQLY